ACHLVVFFSCRGRHTRWPRAWSSDLCSSALASWRRPTSISSVARALSEMLVGRREDAYVDRPRFRPSDPADLLVLQHAQELGLQAERQVADLVEEQRAAVRHLEQPGLGGMGVRKGAALVTEQLGLDEVLGECRAVHGDE